jgi:uncharacterized membrane protein YedE/YeeE
MVILAALGCGILFGAGLGISGMINPQKILGFLDIAGIGNGTWDPTLGVVFAAALAPMFLAYPLARRMGTPACDIGFEIPSRTELDARLIGGSAIFGAGWGLVGLCPGPALAALPAAGTQLPELVIFILAMLAGIWISRRAPIIPENPPAVA